MPVIIVGNPFVCECGIRYSAEVDPVQMLRVQQRLERELRELRAKLRAAGAEDSP